MRLRLVPRCSLIPHRVGWIEGSVPDCRHYCGWMWLWVVLLLREFA